MARIAVYLEKGLMRKGRETPTKQAAVCPHNSHGYVALVIEQDIGIVVPSPAETDTPSMDQA